MIGLILDYIFNFLLSPMAFIAFGLGIVGFFSLPVISLLTGAKQPAKFLFWLGKQPLSRAAIVVSEHNDVYFKQMSFSDMGFEQIKIGDDVKDFEDPDAALHYWLGIPFALADEKKGVLFDPRHAILGERKHSAEQKSEGQYYATDSEWEQFGISKWVKGVFGMPDNHEIADLSNVRKLIDGGERAEYGAHVEERYKHSRDPYNDGTSMWRILMPVIALILGFGAMWFFKSQSSGGSGSVVGFGSIVLLSNTGILGKLKTHWKAILGVLGAFAVGTVMVLVLLSFGGVVFTLYFLWTLIWGLLFLPMLAFLTKPINSLGGAMSNLMFRLGFMGYDKPVFEWTPEKYRLREAGELDPANQPTWYNLFGSLVGFTFTPSPDSWGAEAVSTDELEAKQPVATDGGNVDTLLPSKFVRDETTQRGGMGSFLPKRLTDSYYVWSGVALNRFSDSAIGERSHKRLQKAKDEHGEGSKEIGQTLLLGATLGMGLLGFVLGLVLFFLL